MEEQQSVTTVLESLTGTETHSDRLTPLSDNLMLINQPSQKVQVGTITYDANGGCFITDDHTRQSISYYMEGTVPKPVNPDVDITPRHKDGMIFDGWYMDQEGKKLFNLQEYKCEEDITVYAKWKEPADVKYAVALYGIKADYYKDGGEEKAGLTFGPATTGVDYTKPNKDNEMLGYKAHLPEDVKGKHCIHWDSWEEIIAQSQSGNAEVYRDCLEYGCTKSVELKLNDTLKGEKTYPGMTGDGASILLESIKAEYREWNDQWNTGGWPASRIRATLNGADNLTDRNSSIAGENVLETSNCLLSCFPEELQKAIVAKEVKSDTDYDNTIGSNQITHDKLWLFSGIEYFEKGTSEDCVRPNEGTPYEKAKTYKTYEAGGRNEEGDAEWFWLRSLVVNSVSHAYLVRDDGVAYRNLVDNNVGRGLSPGFCIR